MKSRSDPQLPGGEVVPAARPSEEALQTPALGPVQVLLGDRERRGAAVRVGGEAESRGRDRLQPESADLRRRRDHATRVLEHLPHGERAGEQLR